MVMINFQHLNTRWDKCKPGNVEPMQNIFTNLINLLHCREILLAKTLLGHKE
jgi:hypothetical protein